MEGGVQIHTSLQQDRAQTETDVVEKQTVKAPGAAFLWELKGTVTCRDLGLKERGSEHQRKAHRISSAQLTYMNMHDDPQVLFLEKTCLHTLAAWT